MCGRVGKNTNLQTQLLKLVGILDHYTQAVLDGSRDLHVSVSVIEIILGLVETLLEIGVLRPAEFAEL